MKKSRIAGNYYGLFEWYENAVRPLFAKTSVTRKFWFVHLIHIVHLVLYGPRGPDFK